MESINNIFNNNNNNLNLINMKNEVIINGVEYIRKDTITPIVTNTLKAVLIRSYGAGVHFGYLKNEVFTPAGKVVTLTKTRRVHYWEGAASLSQMALEGIKDTNGKSRISVVLDENEIINVIETIPLSQEAIYNLYNLPIWKV